MIELSSQYKVEEPFVQQNDHFDDKGGDEEEMNGSGFQPDKRQKEDRASPAAVLSVVERERLTREGGKELRDKREREVIVKLR